MKRQERPCSSQRSASTPFMQLRSSWSDFYWAFPSNVPWHGIKHKGDMKQLKRRGGDRDSNGKQTSISCSGEVSQRAAANFSLECLDDSSFHTWPSEVTGTIYWRFSPQGGFCAHAEDACCPLGCVCARCAALRGCTPCCWLGQAPRFCREGACAPCAIRYQTRWQPPSPLRHPNCGRL